MLLLTGLRQGVLQAVRPANRAAGAARVEPLAYFSSAASPGQPGPSDTPRPTDKAAAAAINAAAAAAAADAAAAAGESATSAEDLGMGYGSMVPKLVVFGGSGYVGSRVCQQGLQMGLAVTSVSRHGRPGNLRGDWLDRVEWVKGDALDPQQPWNEVMKGSLGVISTLGAFGSNDFMYKVCGTANMELMDAAADAGVPRFAFISVHDYNKSFPAGWHVSDFLLRGYFQGKRDAEKHLAEKFPTSGVALRPSFIYGSRAVGSASIPLGAIGAPLEMMLRALPTRNLSAVPIVGAAFVPPISVDAVAKAAVTAVVDPAVPPGPMDVWTIAKYA